MVKGRVLVSLAVVGVVCAWGGIAHAQDVIMNSAETINKGNFKVAGFPTVVFNEDATENEWGFHGRLGYGLTNRLDIEAKFAKFNNLKFYGADVELWVIGHPQAASVSVALGVDRTDNERSGGGLTGLDGTLLLSIPISPRVELYGGFLASRQTIRGTDRSFNRGHFAPGVEIRLADNLDLLGEVGLGTTKDSLDYGSVGLAFYLR